MNGADGLEGLSIGDPLGWRPSTSGNLGRTTTQRGRTADASLRPTIHTGLWGSPSISAVAKEPIDEGLEELPPMSPKSRPVTPVETSSIFESKLSSPVRGRSSTVQSTGLWGRGNSNLTTNPTSGEGTWSSSSSGTWDSGSINRARSPAKRRWTAVSNSP